MSSGSGKKRKEEQGDTVRLPTTPVIGRLNNKWRQRRVVVHEHPTDPGMVVSVGYPYGGGNPVVCEEPRSYFEREIKAFPRELIYD